MEGLEGGAVASVSEPGLVSVSAVGADSVLGWVEVDVDVDVEVPLATAMDMEVDVEVPLATAMDIDVLVFMAL